MDVCDTVHGDRTFVLIFDGCVNQTLEIHIIRHVAIGSESAVVKVIHFVISSHCAHGYPQADSRLSL